MWKTFSNALRHSTCNIMKDLPGIAQEFRTKTNW